jgi:integrase/recombinase XerD
VFELLRVNKPRMLPTVLSTTEVRALLASVRHPVRRRALATIYALGLRLGEGLRLEAAHVDAERLMVWVPRRQGRQGPRRAAAATALGAPSALLEAGAPVVAHSLLLRPDERAGASARDHPAEDLHRRPHRARPRQTRLHTLRHRYATHLLESGISLRTIQAILGHQALRTTEIYLHVTQPGVERVQDVLDRLMVDL